MKKPSRPAANKTRGLASIHVFLTEWPASSYREMFETLLEQFIEGTEHALLGEREGWAVLRFARFHLAEKLAADKILGIASVTH